MATERAVLQGYAASAVNIRSMFTCDVIPSGGDTQQILWAAYMNPLRSDIVAISHTSISFYQYELQYYAAGQWVPYDLISISNAGAGTGDALPNQSAIVLIGKAFGIHGIGRKFLSGVPEAAQSAGALVAPYVAGVATVLLDYITPFTGLGGGQITPGVLDKNSTFRPFVGGFVSSLLGSMRRRKPGVGF